MVQKKLVVCKQSMVEQLKTKHHLNNEFKSSWNQLNKACWFVCPFDELKDNMLQKKSDSWLPFSHHSVAILDLLPSRKTSRFPHMSVRAVSRRRQPFTRRGQVLSRPGDFICSPLGRADISYGGEPTHKQLKFKNGKDDGKGVASKSHFKLSFNEKVVSFCWFTHVKSNWSNPNSLSPLRLVLSSQRGCQVVRWTHLGQMNLLEIQKKTSIKKKNTKQKKW